jgi:hypothetical protein
MPSFVRPIIVFAAAALAFAGLVMPAANAYPPTVCATVSVNTTTPPEGGTIVVTGTQFTAGDSLQLKLQPGDFDLGTFTVAANGTFRAVVKLPAGVTGHRMIVVIGGGPSCPVDPVSIDIGAGHATGGGTASTGTNVAMLLGAALLLLVVGGALTERGSTKRRRRRGRRPHRARHAAV